MTDDVLFERRGAAGLVTLNRPKALNALTLDMVVAMKARLAEWAADPAVRIVVVRGEGERAFCAGGDVRAAALSIREGGEYARAFWREEYRLNIAIKRYPKPYLALTHGIVMGGGAGISVHGAYRVADETTLFAMPETGIGFIPDIGASWFLPRGPGETGMYLALTGARLEAADMLYAGIATHYVPRGRQADLLAALAEGASPDEALAALSADPGAAPMREHRALIDDAFAAESAEDVLHRLESDAGAFARETGSLLRSKSPTSIKLALRQMRAGRALSFEDCMKMEFRLASRLLTGHDFYEGVRAQLIDKDMKPAWKPSKLADIREDDIAAYFAPLGEEEFSS